MPRTLLPFAFLTAMAFAPIYGSAQPPFTLISVNVDFPYPGKRFSGAGADVMNNNCITCHSAGMVLKQPALPRTVWQAEVEKMINAYNAPISADDVAAIVDYLVKAKGTR